MSRRVLLHVGCPKTGTSYLQDVLFRNQAVLREHDILYPADRFDAHFLAALDLMTLPWGGIETEAVGAWDRLAAQVREWHGTSIISHEIFARATPAAGRARARLARRRRGPPRAVGARPGAPDPGGVAGERQAPQPHHLRPVPRDHPRPRARLADRVVVLGGAGAARHPRAVGQRRCRPSGSTSSRCRRPGSDRGELWRRFSRTFGLDDLPLDLTAERENPSLGVPETSLLRTINQRVTSIIAPPDYRPLVREVLAHQTLSRGVASARLGLAPEDHAWARDLSRSWIAVLAERGYDVVGSLDDLVGPEPGTFADPDTTTADQLLPPALDAISALLVEGARLRAVEERLHEELREAREELDRARATLGHRARRKVVTTLEDSPAGRGTLDAYRRLRGRKRERG